MMVVHGCVPVVSVPQRARVDMKLTALEGLRSAADGGWFGARPDRPAKRLPRGASNHFLAFPRTYPQRVVVSWCRGVVVSWCRGVVVRDACAVPQVEMTTHRRSGLCGGQYLWSL